MSSSSLSQSPSPKKSANGKAPTRWSMWFKVKLPTFFRKVFRLIVKTLTGAVILTYMAERAPGLREKLPYFYEYVDIFVEMLESLCKFLFQ